MDDCSNPDIQKFLDLLDSFGLQPRSNQHTVTVTRLKRNEKKTEIMFIGTRQLLLNKFTRNTLTVCINTSVTVVNKARNLGVWFDSKLNFDVKITKLVCSQSLYLLHNIYFNVLGIKHLTYQSAQTFILTLVTGRLDCCDSLLYETLPQGLSGIPRVLITFGTSYQSNTMHNVKIIMLTFKALHDRGVARGGAGGPPPFLFYLNITLTSTSQSVY